MLLHLLCAFLIYFCKAEEKIIAIGDAEIEKEKFSILPIYYDDKFKNKHKMKADEIFKILIDDFNLYKMRFDLTANSLHDSKFGHPDFPKWASNKTDYLAHVAAISGNSGTTFGLQVKLYRINNQTIIFDKIFFFEKNINIRYFAHSVSDYIFKKITAKPSLFLSRLVFVSDKLSVGKEVTKELFLMDYDGHNIKQLTSHNGIVISPAASYDGKLVLYGLLKSQGNKAKGQIFLSDLEKGTSTNVITRPEMIMGAVFPDGEHVALSLNNKDNTNIFSLNLKTKQLRKITDHSSDNVDPSVAQDGQLMAFLSGRSGPPMIYLLDPRGTELNVQRVSFIGKYNASPHFSPLGTEIVFSSWPDSQFDLYRINRDGSGLVRLTKDFGSCEGARFSPDGEFIAFSSQRIISSKIAVQDIFLATRNGDILSQVTKNFGHTSTPRWVTPMKFLFE